MATMGDGFKDVFLMGVGAMALTAEKTKELVDSLVSKGEITVEQGKQVTGELTQKAAEAAKGVRDDVLKAAIDGMTPQQREDFLKKASAYADAAAAKESQAAVTAEEVQAEAPEAWEPQAEVQAEVVDVEDVVEEDTPEKK